MQPIQRSVRRTTDRRLGIRRATMTLSLIALVAPLSSCVSGKRDVSAGAVEGHDNAVIVSTDTSAADPAQAQFLSALRHETGNARAIDLATAARLYRRAARAGHPAAQNNLGLMYLEGRGVERSLGEARKWLGRSAQQGFAKAEQNLAVLHTADAVRSRAERASKNPARARAAGSNAPMRLAATGADDLPARAKGSIGSGTNKPGKDRGVTAEWYREAAAKGSPTAQHLTGLMFLEGKGTERNPSKAAAWFGRAAEQGFAQSEFLYGWLQLKGLGVPKDHAAAARLMRRAADQGVAQAQLSLGLMYLQGQGVAENDRQATRWLESAASQGLAPAKYNLALAHLRDRATNSDPRTAFQLLQSAARGGHVASMTKIGELYQSGRGVDEDPISAFAWYGIAADHGDDLAIERRRQLASRMSKIQLTKAQSKLDKLRSYAAN